MILEILPISVGNGPLEVSIQQAALRGLGATLGRRGLIQGPVLHRFCLRSTNPSLSFTRARRVSMALYFRRLAFSDVIPSRRAASEFPSPSTYLRSKTL